MQVSLKEDFNPAWYNRRVWDVATVRLRLDKEVRLQLHYIIKRQMEFFFLFIATH